MNNKQEDNMFADILPNDEIFKKIEKFFNRNLKRLNISQAEIDQMSENCGYFPAEKVDNVSYNKQLKIHTLMKHQKEIVNKISGIEWHLSALNKLIKDYKAYM